MEHTSNYELSKWAESDRILMEDFNMDHDKIDAALAALNLQHVYTGTYVGDYSSGRTIPLPFTPKFLIILGYYGSSPEPVISFVTPESEAYVVKGNCTVSSDSISIVENGFSINLNYWHNSTGRTERFIAFQ